MRRNKDFVFGRWVTAFASVCMCTLSACGGGLQRVYGVTVKLLSRVEALLLATGGDVHQCKGLMRPFSVGALSRQSGSGPPECVPILEQRHLVRRPISPPWPSKYVVTFHNTKPPYHSCPELLSCLLERLSSCSLGPIDFLLDSR